MSLRPLLCVSFQITALIFLVAGSDWKSINVNHPDNAFAFADFMGKDPCGGNESLCADFKVIMEDYQDCALQAKCEEDCGDFNLPKGRKVCKVRRRVRTFKKFTAYEVQLWLAGDGTTKARYKINSGYKVIYTTEDFAQ